MIKSGRTLGTLRVITLPIDSWATLPTQLYTRSLYIYTHMFMYDIYVYAWHINDIYGWPVLTDTLKSSLNMPRRSSTTSSIPLVFFLQFFSFLSRESEVDARPPCLDSQCLLKETWDIGGERLFLLLAMACFCRDFLMKFLCFLVLWKTNFSRFSGIRNSIEN